MYKALTTVLFLFSVAVAAQAQDPVKVDPQHYKVEFENAQVRVLRVTVGPHEKSVMHRHPNAVAVFMTDSNAKFAFPKGDPVERPTKAGQVLWTPAVVHLPENTGDQPFEVILVELKSKPMKKVAKKVTTTTPAPTTTK
jgi:quercetin dioxygenase-like cupin family protein